MYLLDAPARLAGALLPRVWSRLPVAEQTLYLTFDDGPSRATETALERLRAHGARATFFVLGEAAAAHPDLVEAVRAGGHTVGSHGWRHSDPWRTRDPDRWQDVGDARWIRPPYGHVTPALLRHARRHDQHVALWDVMPADFDPRRSPEQITARVLARLRPGSIAVLHDGPEMAGRVGRVLDLLLPRLRDEGWELAALPDQPAGAET